MLNQLEQPQPFAQANDLLLQGVLEGLTDGILILSDRGEWIYHNYYAYRICQQLNQGKTAVPRVPEAIWQACKALIESRDIYANQPVVMESEIAIDRSNVYRIRVRWLTLDEPQHPYLAVLLENRWQASQNRALAEALLYDLSQRQTEVWLLRRAGLTYQQIAIELYITVNTVKTHLKDIRLKQRMVIDLEDKAGA
ncbi:helix-turn-helix transcriptional regulator [Stenomitos frigidus]|uniref:Helix-turn-helix transcriptional regulator n=1 Tax=Stenomitos frigidus ULC18 TaxID=2107698 RepID=A0A2T1E5N5_9CYAN|nr:sigma factor-like helix-turn-helix DNA-binding protein [Stenomitos frigidus]PSB28063.1 helix-turn-helix transcriptional regulator [Stenomitos frigidus ULC18]